MFATNNTPASEIPFSLSGQLRRHSLRFGAGFVCLAVYWAAQYKFNVWVKEGIDAAKVGDSDAAMRIGAFLISLAVGAFFVRVLSRLAVFNGGRIAEYELRKVLQWRLQQLGPSFYRHMTTGEVMSRMTSDLLQVRLLLGFAVLFAANAVFALASSLTFMLTESVPLTLASLASVPFLMIVTRSFSGKIFLRQRENQDAIGHLSSAVQSSIAGVRVVRSFGLEQEEIDRFERSNREYLVKSLRLARLRGLFGPIMQAVSSIGVVVLFWYGGSLLLQGEIAEGTYVAFLNALRQLVWPLISMGFLVSMIQRGRAGYARLKEIYDATPEVVDGPRPAPVNVRGRLDVRGLSFAFDDEPALSDVSLTLPESGSIAIVGRTGSGKSTLGRLLARLLPTPAKSVFIDGTDICQLPLKTVRDTVCYAQQDAFLFSTTVGRNIGYSLDEPESPEGWNVIREASREAQVLDEIHALPHGFHTVVGERGVQLSGGQKQRTALARTFVAAPKVLILDDPLSAVDAKTEKAILQAIDRQLEHRAVMLITHRVSAASRCDSIIVLDEGRVVEQGTHDELLRRGGLYAIFAEEQRLEGELDALSEPRVEL